MNAFYVLRKLVELSGFAFVVGERGGGGESGVLGYLVVAILA